MASPRILKWTEGACDTCHSRPRYSYVKKGRQLWLPQCGSCHGKRLRKKRGVTKERDWALRRTYGITWETYVLLRKAQGNRCAICRNRPAKGRILSVDHNHSTGAVRGLLCQVCNCFLGRVKEHPGTAAAPFTYLMNGGDRRALKVLGHTSGMRNDNSVERDGGTGNAVDG